jgi:2-phosphoglycerate kinase
LTAAGGLPRCILIGGASHLGKSSVARHIAAALGFTHVSTDSLARHPGRPWPTPDWAVPPHVAEHYGTLTDDELIASVLTHYRNMAPMIAELVRERSEEGLVLEGSALLPETAAGFLADGIGAVWLVADDGLTSRRIRAESRYDRADETGRHLIDRFIARNVLLNAVIRDTAVERGLPVIEVTEQMTVAEVADRCLLEIQRGT